MRYLTAALVAAMLFTGLMIGPGEPSPVAGESGESTKTATARAGDGVTKTPSPKPDGFSTTKTPTVRPEGSKTPNPISPIGGDLRPCTDDDRRFPIDPFKPRLAEDAATSGPGSSGSDRDDDGKRGRPECRKLEVRAIVPSFGPPGQEVRREIVGKGFTPGMKVALIEHLDEPIMAQATRVHSLTVEFKNASHLKAIVPPLPPGRYDLLARTPNGQYDKLRNAYRVMTDAPVIEQVRPRSSPNDRPTDIHIQGYNFREGLSVTLFISRTNPISEPVAISQTILLSDGLRVESRHIKTIVPEGLTPGVYRLTVTNPDGKSDSLERGFIVLPAPKDDLWVDDEDIFTDPRRVRAGDIVALGARVHRRGGADPVRVEVAFYLGEPRPSGLITKTSKIMDPRSSENFVVRWDTLGLSETVKITVVVDPDNLIDEFTNENNVAMRRVKIYDDEREDTRSPVIREFELAGGATETMSRTIRATLIASDNVGINSMFIREWIFVAAGQWIPVTRTGWISYTENFSYTLVPDAGAHVLVAWVADRAGNISKPRRDWINYHPATDTLRAGGVDLFRQDLREGQKLDIDLTTLEGDADLYVFGPGGLLAYSINAGTEPDSVALIAPRTGVYWIEIVGYKRSIYSVDIDVSNPGPTPLVSSRVSSAIPDGKTLRTQSLGMLADDPTGEFSEVPDEALGVQPYNVFIASSTDTRQAGW